MTVDFIMDWSEHPDQRVWLPSGSGREIGAVSEAPLRVTSFSGTSLSDAVSLRFAAAR